MYIAIAGNIGSGKTTLTEILTKHYGAKAYYEDIVYLLPCFSRSVARCSISTSSSI